MDAIIFIGPQGSGKGTQAKILAQKLNYFYWEMGGIFRNLRNEQTEIAKKITELIDQGTLVPDHMMMELVKDKLAAIPGDQGIIFDGIPRRLSQAEFLTGALKDQNRSDIVTLYVSLPKEESMNRLMKRAEIEGRADDTPEKIQFRLEQYEKDTVPVLDFLRQHSRLIEIDGTPSIEEVTTKINQALEL